MKTICIYHSIDLDGWMSGAIVKLATGDQTTFVGYNYGSPIPNLLEYNRIILVDISLPAEIMLCHKEHIIWIDHHSSAIKDSLTHGYADSSGIRDTGKAACELTWEFFFPNNKMPEVVRLLGRYDCFGHKGTGEEQLVLNVQFGARAEIRGMDDAYKTLTIARGNGDWALDGDIVDIYDEMGSVIYKYLCTEANGIYQNRMEVWLGGKLFACVNRERFNPINFGIDYHKDGYDGFACFHYYNGEYHWSLYNDNGTVNCSDLAKAMGGGGHRGAAGFRTHNAPGEFLMTKK